MAIEELMTESSEDDKQSTEATEETKVEETEKEEEVKEDSKEEGFKGKFDQFTAKNVDEYLNKIEDAYLNSTHEGQRLNRELKETQAEMETISKVINADPNLKSAFAEKLYGTGYSDDDSGITPAQVAIIKAAVAEAVGNTPALKSMEQDRTEKDRQVYVDFLEKHQELNTNPEMVAELEEYFGVIANATAQKGDIVDFKKTLYKAWNVVSGGNELDGMKKVYQKENASISSSSSEGKSSPTRTLTPAEKSLAEAFGLSEKDYLEGKKLSEESK